MPATKRDEASERVVKLETIALTYETRLAKAEKLIEDQAKEHDRDKQAWAEQRRELERDIDRLQYKVEELEKRRDTTSTRAWTIVLALASAIIGGIILPWIKNRLP
jgi:hypothetical protein